MKPHYHVVCAIIEHKGKILCMQKGKTRYAYTSYHWEFPGGKIEDGETPQEALHRELLEEMNYDILVGGSLGEVTHSYPDFTITMQGFLCHASTDVFQRKEHNDHRWLDANELNTLEWCEADVPFVYKITARCQ